MDFIIIFKLLLTFVFSFIFGIERQKSHKQVGFGTFIFVSIGSCALSIIALNFSVDSPLPLLGAIITGIGFLGAGALIRNRDKIFGFTTAAAIWVFAIFGVSIGVGEYFVGIILYSFIWIAVFFDKHMEKKGTGSYRTRLTIETNKIICEENVRKFLENVGIKKTKLIKFNLKKPNKGSFSYLVEGESDMIKKIPNLVKRNRWIHSLTFE